MTFLATFIASSKFLSTSIRTSLEAPLNRIVQALGFTHLVRKVKYSSPNFLISNRPHSVPISASLSSSGLWTMQPPTARATRFMSDFLRRRMAVMLALRRKCWARSETPFSGGGKMLKAHRLTHHFKSLHTTLEVYMYDIKQVPIF